MCLYNFSQWTRMFLDQHKGEKWIWAYKIVRVKANKAYSTFSPYEWHGGWNRANMVKQNRKASPVLSYSSKVFWGIHVYLEDRKGGVCSVSGNSLLRVKCYLKDLLGVGETSSIYPIPSAAFRKVFVSKDDLKKAIAGVRGSDYFPFPKDCALAPWAAPEREKVK